jgi:outer membrane protein OmpA-like peptidoglycan-associated protein
MAPPTPSPSASVAKPILAAPVKYGLKSDAIPEEFQPFLSNLAEAMREPEAFGKTVLITGHTDSL